MMHVNCSGQWQKKIDQFYIVGAENFIFYLYVCCHVFGDGFYVFWVLSLVQRQNKSVIALNRKRIMLFLRYVANTILLTFGIC